MQINSNKNDIFNGIVISLLGLLTEKHVCGCMDVGGRVVPLQSWQGLSSWVTDTGGVAWIWAGGIENGGVGEGMWANKPCPGVSWFSIHPSPWATGLCLCGGDRPGWGTCWSAWPWVWLTLLIAVRRSKSMEEGFLLMPDLRKLPSTSWWGKGVGSWSQEVRPSGTREICTDAQFTFLSSVQHPSPEPGATVGSVFFTSTNSM